MLLSFVGQDIRDVENVGHRVAPILAFLPRCVALAFRLPNYLALNIPLWLIIVTVASCGYLPGLSVRLWFPSQGGGYGQRIMIYHSNICWLVLVQSTTSGKLPAMLVCALILYSMYFEPLRTGSCLLNGDLE